MITYDCHSQTSDPHFIIDGLEHETVAVAVVIVVGNYLDIWLIVLIFQAKIHNIF